jgi:hypothetical protein
MKTTTTPKVGRPKYETTMLFRTQAEIVTRFCEAMGQPGRSIEAPEYLRVMSFYHAQRLKVNGSIMRESDWAKDTDIEIQFTAEALLRRWENQIMLGAYERSKQFTQMYVAFKWILGHPDCDTFPGALDQSYGGIDNGLAFQYVAKQLRTGAWQKLTTEAKARKRGEL